MQHALRRLSRLAVAAGAALLAAPEARAISGVCPDGSIFIVRSADQIPCRNAKQVEPDDLPPLNPEFLPRPYGWERFNRETDPNNPYNLVDSQAPGVDAPPPPAPGTSAPQATGLPGAGPQPAPPPETRTALAPSPAPGPPAPGPDLALAESELADLVSIVELMQDHAPAAIVKRDDATGEALATLRLARSAAFDRRLHAALAAAGTPIEGRAVLFTARASRPDAFWGNLTFVQGHVAFHPDHEDPSQFGLLAGRLGPLRPEDRLLGYAVLPAHVDPAEILDIYWDDRQTRARLP